MKTILRLMFAVALISLFGWSIMSARSDDQGLDNWAQQSSPWAGVIGRGD
jgi:hypothetical protein